MAGLVYKQHKLCQTCVHGAADTGESFEGDELDDLGAKENSAAPVAQQQKHAALFAWAQQRSIPDEMVDRFLTALGNNEREVKQRLEQKKVSQAGVMSALKTLWLFVWSWMCILPW